MSSQGFIFSLFVALFFINAMHHSQGGTTQSVDVNVPALKEEDVPMYPLVEDGKYEMMMVLNETRRKLGSFQICALCTCCGGARGVCLPSPCCYAINCNIPNRPFGFCSFTPKSCNCLGCHL